ncbi:bifunctional helix-turn-helix transcriptional regulator/GNAT family N-acetyltransferase [Planococcus shixiaomingii]|uniref:bifunctional helix-turn-helix transcriptional regulator/GNAT family N-acetyltransferase n=1 Tax=Planococcus shixiaomingii TaxID=3058393 RepID=UPI00262768A7|nr:helix-turn-helix domain-containing GNAT family N-acetyltransferase [Planococcus sp. N022]WKA53034.1 helix-turn-helix domain-containing GNAT family N-acetyltransferase [Planococcus sp. N022]
MPEMKHVERIRKFNRYYANVLGKIDQEIYNRPYSLLEARVISELHDKQGAIAKDIREKLGIDRGYMSRIFQKFEADELIEKKQSPDDKRQQLLYLTEAGETIYRDLVDNANLELSKMVDQLADPDLAKLTTAMKTIETLLHGAAPTPDQVVIRPFRAGDIGYVAYLHGIVYGKTYHFSESFEYYVLKGLTEFMANREGGELWIAEVNGEIAGSIAITKATDDIAQLRWFVLDENYQGLGIGKQLMKTALAFCRAQQYRQVFLWTVNILGAARYLYESNGFVLTEKKPNTEWADTELYEERWDLKLIERQ